SPWNIGAIVPILAGAGDYAWHPKRGNSSAGIAAGNDWVALTTTRRFARGNFEWSQFGLWFVDSRTQRRIPKASGRTSHGQCVAATDAASIAYVACKGVRLSQSTRPFFVGLSRFNPGPMVRDQASAENGFIFRRTFRSRISAGELRIPRRVPHDP